MKQTTYRNKRILITGGAGFIGSALAEELVRLDAHVTILDDFSTGLAKNLKTIQNRITLITGSILDKATCALACSDQEIIFHCAAFISVPLSFEEPEACYRSNVEGTHNLLDAARKNGSPRFLLCSSAAVYGNQSGLCHEQLLPAPTSPYGFSKLMAEQLSKEYATCFGLATLSPRFFNVFGKRQRRDLCYPGFIASLYDALEQNKSVTFYGDGKQVRDFIPVEDVVKTLLHLALLPKEFLNGSPINIATGKSISLLEMFHTLKKNFSRYSCNPIFLPKRAGDIAESYADCTMLNRLLRITLPHSVISTAEMASSSK